MHTRLTNHPLLRTNVLSTRPSQMTSILAELIKKSVDIGCDVLKVSNKRYHIFTTLMPLISLIISLIGLGLLAVAVIKEEGQPRWVKVFSLIVLALIAAGAVSILCLSFQFSVLALAIGFAVIALGFSMDFVKFCRASFTYLSLIINKEKVLDEQANSCEQLVMQQDKLAKQQVALIYQIKQCDDDSHSQQLKNQVVAIQKSIIKVDNTINKIMHPDAYFQLRKEEAKNRVFSSLTGLLITIGSCMVGILALTLGLTNPFFAIGILVLGLAFDCASLFRHSNNLHWHRKKGQFTHQRRCDKHQHLIHEANMTLKVEEEQVRTSYAEVLNQLPKTQLPIESEVTNENIPAHSVIASSLNSSDLAVDSECDFSLR